MGHQQATAQTPTTQLSSDTIFLERGKGFSPPPNTHFRGPCQSPLAGSPSNWYKSEIPDGLNLGSINLLAWLTELKRNISLGDFRLIVKGWNAVWVGMGEGRRASPSPRHPVPSPRSAWGHPARSLSPVLLGHLCTLHYVGMVDCISVQWAFSPMAPLSSPRSGGGVCKFQPHISQLVPPETSSPPP